MSTVSFGQAIRDAIEAEKSASGYYRALAKRVRDEEARQFIDDMAAQEDEHARSLEELSRRLDDGELPSLTSATPIQIEQGVEPSLSEEMSLVEAVRNAIAAEEGAQRAYLGLAEVAEGEARELFNALAATESRHAYTLKTLLLAIEAMAS
jgi:rubrerythrin